MFDALVLLGLEPTLLSVGVACFLAASPRITLGTGARQILRPIASCGRRSDEINLTHMFVVQVAVGWFYREQMTID